MTVDTRRVGPSLPVSFAVLGVGIALAVAGGVGVGFTFGRSLLTSPAVALPAHLQRHLDHGTYAVYQRTGTSGGGGGFTFSSDRPTTITPSDVVVTSSIGQQIAVEPAGNVSETLTRGSAAYTAAVTFDVTESGDYTIDVQERGGGFPEAVVTRTLGSAAHAAAGWFVMLGFGVLTAAIGLVLLIVGIVRRSRASRPAAGGYVPAYAAAAPQTPPPAWYPDPGGSGQQRWWDGSRWTDHLT